MPHFSTAPPPAALFDRRSQAARDYAKAKGYKIEIVPIVEFHDQKITYPGGRVGNHVANYAFAPGLSADESMVCWAKDWLLPQT